MSLTSFFADMGYFTMKLYHSYISLTELYENVTKRYLAVCIELEFLVSVATSMVTLPGLVLTEK